MERATEANAERGAQETTPRLDSRIVRDHNRRAWDSLVRKGHGFTVPSREEEFRRPLEAVDSAGWLGPSVTGKRVLCLAAGGGRYGVLLAAAGALVTVVDISPEMLAMDRRVAAERGLHLRTVEASMEDLSALPEAGFDVVAQPVSTCYVENLAAVYREVARVTAGGGLYISQHKQPASLQAGASPSAVGYELTEPYYRSGPLPSVAGSRHREEGTLEFLHRWEQLIGGLCRAGFVVEDLIEPLHAQDPSGRGSFAHRSRYLPPYVRIKARRVSRDQTPGPSGGSGACKSSLLV